MKKHAVWLALLAVLGLTARGGTFDFVIQTTQPNQTFAFYTEWFYNAVLDWGDGTTNKTSAGGYYGGKMSHDYVNPGVYTNRFSGSAATRISFGGEAGTTPLLLRDIVSRMRDGIPKVTSAYRMFAGATNITQFTQADWFDGLSTNVTNMAEMFANAKRFNQDISRWNVGKVTDMYAMFSGATAFNQDLGAWDVRNVTKMNYMFKDAVAFNQEIGGWNVGKVTNMERMFNNATAFNQDIGGWNVTNVTAMWAMFGGASAFNQDIGGWNVSKVTSMGEMFASAVNFNQDIGGWDVRQVTTMMGMFQWAYAFNQDISRWNVSKVDNFGSFLFSHKLPTPIYDRLLIRWSRLALRPNVSFYGGSSKYDLGLPADARQRIKSTFNWTITDGGTTYKLYPDGGTRVFIR